MTRGMIRRTDSLSLLPINSWDCCGTFIFFKKVHGPKRWRNSHLHQTSEIFLFHQVSSHRVFVPKFLLCKVRLAQRKLIIFLISSTQIISPSNDLVFHCSVKFWLSEVRRCTGYVHPLRSMWKSDLKTGGFMVLKAKAALQHQTNMRKEVFGLKTAIKCFSFLVHDYLWIFLWDSRPIKKFIATYEI